ncbi:MAG: TRAP transporter large permease subunit, partial [Pseudomonadota bacterium]
LSSIILDYSGGHLILILIMTTIMGVVLGMGMPTSGAYIILAALLAPGLVEAGVPLLGAHMFIMYVAAKSSITPPVAIASYAAAAVAGTDPWRTSLVAFKLGLSVFIIPYMFVYGPALLGLGTPLEVAYATATASLGVFILSAAIVGWFVAPLGWGLRLATFVSSLFLIQADWRTDLVGTALFASVAVVLLVRQRRSAGAAQRSPSPDGIS